MNRKTTGEDIKNIIAKIRKELPQAILRTSIIVGFPGETEEDFEKLCTFIKETKFDKLGVFTYSKEENTPASRLKDQIHWKTKQKRWNIIMQIQQEISHEKLKEKIGKTYIAQIESAVPTKGYIPARTYMDVPDMDGVLWIKTNKKLEAGRYIPCKITDVSDYDLVGEYN